MNGGGALRHRGEDAETQFGGEIPAAKEDAPSSPLFVPVPEQMGLRFEAAKGVVDVFVVDRLERSTAD